MRTILAIVILLAIGWSGYWYLHASARERAVNGWLEERRAAGWVAEAERVRVAGFPNRVDTFVTGLALADPRAGWSWKASELEILSLSYMPWKVIAVLPGEQVVATPVETMHITSDRLRGSVIFKPTPRLELDHSTFEIEGMKIASDLGWTGGVGKAILATRQAAGEDAPPFAHDVAVNAENLTLPAGLAANLGTGQMLPASIGTVSLDATLAFDRPWDRQALETDNPVLEGVVIRDVALTWGKLDLRGRGSLDVDAQGFAEGKLDLTARNWRDMIDLIEQSGTIGSGVADAARTGLDLIARFSGDSKTLKVPLTFSDGVARLGPIVLGPAPRLARRG